MNRDVEGREAILEDSRDVALLHIGERGEIAVRERQPVIVVADVEVSAKPGRKAFDEAELASIGASSNRWRLESDTELLALRALDLVDDFVAVGLPRLDDEIGRAHV